MCIQKYSQELQLAKPPKYIPTAKWISWSIFTKHNVLQERKWTIYSYPNIQMTLTNMLNKTNKVSHSVVSGSSVHGILQAKILEWVAIPFSRGSFQPRDQIWVSCTTGRFLNIWATRETQAKTRQTQKSIYKIWCHLLMQNTERWKQKNRFFLKKSRWK